MAMTFTGCSTTSLYSGVDKDVRIVTVNPEDGIVIDYRNHFCKLSYTENRAEISYFVRDCLIKSDELPTLNELIKVPESELTKVSLPKDYFNFEIAREADEVTTNIMYKIMKLPK